MKSGKYESESEINKLFTKTVASKGGNAVRTVDMNSKKVWFGVLATFIATYAVLVRSRNSADLPHWLIYITAVYLGLLSTEAFFIGLLMNVGDPTRIFSGLNLVILVTAAAMTMFLLTLSGGVAPLVNLMIADTLFLSGIVFSAVAVLGFYLLGHNCAKNWHDEFKEHAYFELVNLAVDSYSVSEAELEGTRTISAVAERIVQKKGFRSMGS